MGPTAEPTAGAAPAPSRREVSGATAGASADPAFDRLVVQVLSVRPHDASSFTEGLLLRDGRLYESGGLYGESRLDEADPETGAVLRRLALAPEVFGEGLALVGDRLIQLTWNEGVAYVYDVASFAALGEFAYEGEGWGLCYDGSRLVMSDGSSVLTLRDPTTFDVIGQVSVALDGQPVQRVNELECVGDSVYANVWLTDNIIRIDEETGRVTAVINSSGLLSPQERAGADVLNGIAYDPESGHFLITGKNWPKLFEVLFVPTD